MSASKGNPRSIPSAYAAVGLITALVVVASFLPHVRLWGINHLSYHRPVVRVILLAIICASFIPAVNERAYAGLGKLYRLVGAGRRGLMLAGLIVAVMMVLFLSLGSSTFLLGDGVYVFNNMTVAAEKEITPKDYLRNVTLSENSWSFVKGHRTAASVNPGSDLLNFLSSYALRRAFGADALTGVRVLSALMGGLLVVALLVFLRRMGGGAPWPACAALVVLGSGAVQLFFGYVENYAPVLLVGVVYALTAYRALSGRGSIGYPLAMLVVAVLLHAQALMLLPSTVFLIVWAAWLKKRPALWGVAWKSIAAVTVAGAVIAALTGVGGDYYLALTGGTYAAFSLPHLLDVVNELLLLLPAGLIFYVLGAVSEADPDDANGTRGLWAAFAWCLLVPCCLFLLLFRPDLGMARDWDLFAFTGLGFAVPAVLGLRRFLRSGRLARHYARVVVPALTVSLVLTFAWITVNADAERSVRRFTSILEYDKTGQAYAYETLAKQYEVRGDRDGQLGALQSAYNVSRNPRYKVKIAEIRGDESLVVEGLREMLDRDPANDAARGRLLHLLMMRGDTDGVIDVAATGMRQSPQNSYYPYCMGRALIAQGKLREGVAYFERCQQLDAPPELLREIDMVLEELERRLGIEP
jgi:hypothetical protein